MRKKTILVGDTEDACKEAEGVSHLTQTTKTGREKRAPLQIKGCSPFGTTYPTDFLTSNNTILTTPLNQLWHQP